MYLCLVNHVYLSIYACLSICVQQCVTVCLCLYLFIYTCWVLFVFFGLFVGVLHVFGEGSWGGWKDE